MSSRFKMHLDSAHNVDMICHDDDWPHINVATYFLSPHRMPICFLAQVVNLPLDGDNWNNRIRAPWEASIDPGYIVQMFVVEPTPRPQPGQDNIAANVLLLQRLDGRTRGVLLTSIDNQIVVHQAHILPSAVTNQQTWTVAGQARCLSTQHPHRCQAWHRGNVTPDMPPYDIEQSGLK